MPRGELDSRFVELMRRSQDGDSSAYHTLLTEISVIMKRYVESRFRASNDTDEVVQDILMAIHQSRKTYDPNKAFMPWAYAIARYRLIDHLRRWGRTKRREVQSDAYLESLPSNDDSVLGQLEVTESLAAALKELTPQQRETIELLKLKGLSIKEAAKKLGMSESAVKVTAHRGYRKLKKHFGVPISGNA